MKMRVNIWAPWDLAQPLTPPIVRRFISLFAPFVCPKALTSTAKPEDSSEAMIAGGKRQENSHFSVEGFQMNYEVVAYEEAYLEQFIQHPNPMISLHQILTEPSTIYHTPLFDPTDFWGVNLVRGLSEEAIARRLQILFNQPGPSSRSDSIDDVIPLVTDYSIGIMTDEMRRIWVEFGCEKTAVVEEVRAIFEGFSISIVFVLVYDDEERARCACLYFSDAPGGEEIFKRLQEVDPRPPKTIVTDCSATWEKIIEKTYGVDLAMDIDLQISEFHMMSLWAYQTERRVQNRHDQYAIVCALRRWIRIPDPMLFDMFAVQLFEALKEMNLESLFALFDKQLSNEAFARRWIPEKRSEITEHSSPLLEVSVRNFRELFLDNSAVGRFDQYVGLVFHRILEFNRTPKLELYTQRPIDLPRIVPFLSSSEPRDSSPLPAEQEEVDPEQAEEPLGEKSLRELPHDPAFGYEHEHLNPEVEMEEGIQPLMVDGSLKLAKEEAIDEDDEFVLVEVDEHHETTPEMNVDMTPNEQLGAFFCAEAFEIPIEDMECDEIILEAAPE
ncbi:unnamed protein product [Caenorhabditis auriculariae]|uniref:Uncharacterized protein n=1 Tax=Caenorhabditis auriculariae TaxID=2777116 RepID=A0A8S1HZS0_9PELO|nr:unnamed protein product [Caenorhabditis auriculariae]